MNLLKSPLTLLEDIASQYPSLPAFKIPRLSHCSDRVQDWDSITYAEFQRDVELFAKYWLVTLQDTPRGSIVGIWLRGLAYVDVLHIYGVCRAGYIPHLFSLILPSPQIVVELLQKANAKALIRDSYFEATSRSSVPTYVAVDARCTPPVGDDLPPLPVIDGKGLACIFHTSGTTSGSPKLVPYSYLALNAVLQKASLVFPQIDPERQNTSNWMGTIMHAGSSFAMLASIQNAGCIVQPTTLAFSSDELMDMVERCGLNQITQVTNHLATLLRRSRHDNKLLAVLRNIGRVTYTGMSLPTGEEDWAYRNGVNLINIHGATEVGYLLMSGNGQDDSARLLSPPSIDGFKYLFLPIAPETKLESENAPSIRLLEMVVHADSRDCPDPSLRGADGHFHTGDLFEEVQPGRFADRGRDDDWIKSGNALKCDTKAIEDFVRATYGSSIDDCAVVGHGRPSPALFIEPAVGIDYSMLKKEILRGMESFNLRRYPHERISSEDMIIIVPPKSLPRTATKGNIRRRAIEEIYKQQLDGIYGVV